MSRAEIHRIQLSRFFLLLVIHLRLSQRKDEGWLQPYNHYKNKVKLDWSHQILPSFLFFLDLRCKNTSPENLKNTSPENLSLIYNTQLMRYFDYNMIKFTNFFTELDSWPLRLTLLSVIFSDSTMCGCNFLRSIHHTLL